MSDINSVPWLRSGTGTTPQDGGCIMQVIDWVNRNEWTDRPPCVHPVLRRLAIRANDALGDDDRQKLLDLAPRLMNTASNDKKLSVQLAVFCARYVLPIFEAKYPNDDRPRKSIEAAEAWVADPSEENRQKAMEARKAADAYAYAYAAAAYAYAYAAAAYAYAYAADAYADAYAADAAAAAAAAAADAYAAAYAYADADAAAAGRSSSYELLVAILDEYDRLTGRGHEGITLDFTPVCAVMGS